MTPARRWFEGARPRTLPLSIVPVAVGTAAAGHASPVRTMLLVVVALGMQVGVNFANDYSDGVRGVDTVERRGPVRLTATGLAKPRAVARAAFLSLLVAAVAGGVLALMTSLWLVGVGIVAAAAAVGYSGGPAPYGARALGELSVFVFFGLVATAGSAYVQIERIPARAWWAAVPMGLLSAAVLVANNLRDIPTDTAAGKRTFAVVLGDRGTRLLYLSLLGGSFVAIAIGVFVGHLPLACLGTGVLAIPVVTMLLPRLRKARTPPGLVGLLIATLRFHLVFGAVLSVLLWAVE